MQRALNRKNLGSYHFVGVTGSITLALFVTGLFGLLLIYSQELERIVRENIRVQVYLKSGLTEVQRTQVEKNIEGLPFVSKTEPISFVPKEEAAARFIAETGEDFSALLGDNPLHDAFLVSIDPAYQALDEMVKAKAEIEKINGVFQVFYVEGLIDSINRNVARLGLLLLGLVVVLLTTVVLLINNTIRLALFSQRFLIRSMQLVGATKAFIQRPFLMRAIGYGFIAGALASAGIWALVNYANREIEELSLLMNTESMIRLIIGLLVLGVVVALSSTFFSIRRYLKMSLDELY